MKIKTPFFLLEIEWIFLIVFFLFLFSAKIKEMLFSFFICYLFIVFHEFSHMLVASILGKEIHSFKITLSGVCIEFERKKYCYLEEKKARIDYIKNIFIYLAGPLSNIVLAILFHQNAMILQVNLFFAFINLTPLFPLDGYHILDNLLCFFQVSNVIKKYISYCTAYFFFFLFFILGMIQFFIMKNPSILIFLLYLFVIRKESQSVYFSSS